MSKKAQILVNLSYPDGNKLQFKASSPSITSVFSGIKSQPLVFWYTNGFFSTKSGPLASAKPDLSDDLEQSASNGNTKVLNLSFTEKEYSIQTALSHAQMTARIIFTLTAHPEVSDCQQSMIAFFTREYGTVNSGKKIPNEQDYTDYYPQSFLNSSLPKIVKYFDIIEEYVPKANGVFMKFKLITKEKEEFVIEAIKEGFKTSENTKIYSTLYQLFCNVSPFFRDNSAMIAGRMAMLDKLEKIPYEPINRQHIYAIPQKAGKTDSSDGKSAKKNQQLRLFSVNKEIIHGSVDNEISKIKDDDQSKFYICANLEEQYLKQVCDSVKRIESGELKNIEGKKIFEENGVIIEKIESPFEYKRISNYIKSIENIKEMNMNSVKIDRPVLVNYLNNQYVVREGLQSNEEELTSLSTSKSGEIDENDKKFCDQFKCKEIVKGIKGLSINNNEEKIVTFVPNTTPIDLNFVSSFSSLNNQNNFVFYLRPEILKTYEEFQILKKHSEELTELGGDERYDFEAYISADQLNEVKQLSDEQKAKLSQRRTEILNAESNKEENIGICYNLNVSTEDLKNFEADPKNEDIELLKDLSNFIIEKSIPNFVNRFLTTIGCQIDGNYIVQKMHSFGLNVRYLGHLLPHLKSGKSMDKAFTYAIESEMIIRSFKRIARVEHYSIEDLLSKINLMINCFGNNNNNNNNNNVYNESFNTFFEKICEFSELIFGKGIFPGKPKKAQIPYLKRGLMTTFGIVISVNEKLTNYTGDEPNNSLAELKLESIVNVNPKVKFSNTRNKKYLNLIKEATAAYNRDDFKLSYELYQAAIQMSETCVLSFDETLIDCYFYCALIFFCNKKMENAYQAMLESTIMHERRVGLTDTSLIFKYGLLGSIAAEYGNKRLALCLNARTMLLTEMILPFHPWAIEAATDAADAAVSLDSNLALKFALNALEICKRTYSYDQNNDTTGYSIETVNENWAKSNATVAMIALAGGKVPLANKYADEAIRLNPRSQEIKALKAQILMKQYKSTHKRGGRRGGGH